MNQKIIHGLNKHFWRRDIFGLVSYPVSFDGRTADASILREQFGKEGGDGSDGLLHVMLLKARSMFGDEDTFTGLLDKGLTENNFWDILELRVIEVLFQEYYLNDAVKDQVPGVVWGSEIILKKWYHTFNIFGRVQLYDTSHSILPAWRDCKDPITEQLDERYISQYREYLEYSAVETKKNTTSCVQTRSQTRKKANHVRW